MTGKSSASSIAIYPPCSSRKRFVSATTTVAVFFDGPATDYEPVFFCEGDVVGEPTAAFHVRTPTFYNQPHARRIAVATRSSKSQQCRQIDKSFHKPRSSLARKIRWPSNPTNKKTRAAWESEGGGEIPRRTRPATAPVAGTSRTGAGGKRRQQRQQLARAAAESATPARNEDGSEGLEPGSPGAEALEELARRSSGNAQLLQSDRLNNDPQVRGL